MSVYLVSREGLRAVGTALLGAYILSISVPASAQGSPSLAGEVSCFLPPAKLSDQAITQFMANPAGLLAVHPNGGVTLTNLVRMLAGSDFRTVDPLIELARNGPPGVKADIAAGLANTAASCVWTRPDITRLIQERIAASEDAPLVTAFLGVAGAIETTVLGGATGGAAGGGHSSIRGTTIGPGGGFESTATPQGGGLEGLVGGRFSGNSSSDTNNSDSTSRLFKSEGPVSQMVQ